jgi:hypothetical protein
VQPWFMFDNNRNTRWGGQVLPPTDVAYLVWDNKIPGLGTLWAV